MMDVDTAIDQLAQRGARVGWSIVSRWTSDSGSVYVTMRHRDGGEGIVRVSDHPRPKKEREANARPPVVTLRLDQPEKLGVGHALTALVYHCQ